MPDWRGRKDWTDNLAETKTFFLVGIVGTVIGLPMVASVLEGTSGVVVANGVPIPLDLIAFMIAATGVGMFGFAIISAISTLYRRFVKGDKSYVWPKKIR